MGRSGAPQQVGCGRTPRAADRPVGAIFHFNSTPNAVSVHTPVLNGRTADASRWAEKRIALTEEALP